MFRSVYIVNPKFQIKFCFFVVSLIFISSLVYPFVIYDLIGGLINKTADPAIIAALEINKVKLILALALYQLVFIGIVFIISIFQGHKIAGPLYKLKMVLEKVKEGKTPEKLKFRKGDYFEDLEVAFNEAMETLQNHHNGDFAYLSEVYSYLQNICMIVPEDKKEVLLRITHDLHTMQERFKQSQN